MVRNRDFHALYTVRSKWSNRQEPLANAAAAARKIKHTKEEIKRLGNSSLAISSLAETAHWLSGSSLALIQLIGSRYSSLAQDSAHWLTVSDDLVRLVIGSLFCRSSYRNKKVRRDSVPRTR